MSFEVREQRFPNNLGWRSNKILRLRKKICRLDLLRQLFLEKNEIYIKKLKEIQNFKMR